MFSCFRKKPGNDIVIVLHDTTTLFDSNEHYGLPVDRLSKQEFQDRVIQEKEGVKAVLQNEQESTKGSPQFFRKQKAQRKIDKKMQSEPGYRFVKNPLTHG